MEHDLHSRVKVEMALPGLVIVGNSTTEGEVIDTKGFESLEYVIHTNAITSGTFNFILEEDDVIGFTSATTVGIDEILGSVIGFNGAADSFSVKRVGSIGKKRYQRLSVVGANTPIADFIGAVAVLSDAYINPVAEQ